MIVDTSAVIAILRQEPEAQRMADAIAASPERIGISAASALECALVAGRDHAPWLDEMLRRSMTVIPFDAAQLAVARAAHARYGRGSGSPARLNFGDCFAYALATVTGEPLLFKGEDFRHTDVMSAL
jgi:ribonuclease VapC